MLKNATAQRFVILARVTGMGLAAVAALVLGIGDSGVEGPNVAPTFASAPIAGGSAVHAGVFTA
ncbi:hypothetical protein ACSHWB_34755 [Lentzea sp. HUAS TT2]|uniref:hypothetical protein n=1 Tax=Lentzea sp. HUAS TT2 TaxID=3447454 RepID=UPI003F70407C